MSVEPGQIYKSKGISTRVRIVGFRLNGYVVAEYLDGSGGVDHWQPMQFLSAYALVAPKIVRYVNVYDCPSVADTGCLHESREQADKQSAGDRIACIRIEFEKGQMDP